jgi:competence protein ComEC
MGPHDARLVPASLAAYLVAAIMTLGLTSLAVAVVAVFSLTAIVARRSRVAASVVLGAGVAVMVCGTTAAHLESRWQGGIGQAIAGKPVLVSATLIRDPEPVSTLGFDGEPRVRVALRLHAWSPHCGCGSPAQDAEWRPARATITVIAGQPWDQLDFGDRVIAIAPLKPGRPGRDIAVAWDSTIVQTRQGSAPDRAVSSLRDGLRNATAHLPTPVRGLTRGMVIGDTADMPAEQIDDMRTTSLAHLTAVSGSHFAIVLLSTSGLMRVWRWPRKLRAVLAGTIMAGFATLVFPEPSVLRALAMSAVVCAALWWGRPAQALPALAAGMIALLVIDPFLALSFGFALSVAAVAAIVLWAPVLAVHLQRWVTPALAKVISIPLAAQVACTPILVLLNPGVGVYGVVANVVAVAFAVPITLLGMLAVVLAAVYAPVAVAVASVAGLAAWPIAWVSSALAGAPGAWVAWPGGWGGAIALALASATLIVATSANRVPGWWRVATVLAVVGLLLGAPSVRNAVGLSSRTIEDWSVVICDVGQGHMMLLRAAPDAAVVIDVGSPGGGGAECLERHGVTSIPLLILTHPHSDHDGAVSEVARQASIGAAWVSPAGATSPHDGAYRELERLGVPVRVAHAGQSVTVGSVALTVWHPARATSIDDLNDASIVTSGTAGNLTVMNLGDIEEPAQRELLTRLPGAMAVDVVLVAHHGSANQHAPLVGAIDAHLAVVGVGAGNRHGHPAASALELYGARGATVLRTDLCGDVLVARGEQLVLSTDCPELVGG